MSFKLILLAKTTRSEGTCLGETAVKWDAVSILAANRELSESILILLEKFSYISIINPLKSLTQNLYNILLEVFLLVNLLLSTTTNRRQSHENTVVKLIYLPPTRAY